MRRGKFYKEEEIQEYIDENLGEYEIDEDLHHNMFNMDYYIIGTYKAEMWMGNGVFRIMRAVDEYEQDNFGERYTDFSDPEKLLNMYVYIVGEVLLGEMKEELRELKEKREDR
jgi:hypothetical protein